VENYYFQFANNNNKLRNGKIMTRLSSSTSFAPTYTVFSHGRHSYARPPTKFALSRVYNRARARPSLSR